MNWEVHQRDDGERHVLPADDLKPHALSRGCWCHPLIPGLTALREGDEIALILDHRLSISVPKDRAYDVAWLVANALAIGAGYPCFTADKKTEAFAPNCAEIKPC